jgi:class 3 adenylate cyclase
MPRGRAKVVLQGRRRRARHDRHPIRLKRRQPGTPRTLVAPLETDPAARRRANWVAKDDRTCRAYKARSANPGYHIPGTVPTYGAYSREWDDPEEDGYVANLIPNARLVRLPGRDWLAWVGDQDAVVDAIQGFLGAERAKSESDTVLATVMFTDIVDSTRMAAELGDHAWREVVGRHHSTVRALLERHRGVEVDTAGDGFFATFEGPARAVRCAQEIIVAVRPLGMEVRAGIHTGECVTIDGKMGGIAVSIGARVGASAAGSEVLVSQTVRDLVAGSGLTFHDRGERELKGIPDRWRLYAAIDA